jgi:hypothetical protein
MMSSAVAGAAYGLVDLAEGVELRSVSSGSVCMSIRRMPNACAGGPRTRNIATRVARGVTDRRVVDGGRCCGLTSIVAVVEEGIVLC